MMSFIAEFLRRIWYLFNRQRFEQELADEIAEHRARMPDVRRFGNELQVRERSRAVWGWNWLDTLIGDARIALRSLLRIRSVTFTALLSLIVGLTLVASTGAVVRAYSAGALPYPEPEQLHHVMYAPPGPWEPGGMSQMPWASLGDIVTHAIGASSARRMLPDNASEPVRLLRVDTGFVRGLGVRAPVGRELRDLDFANDGEAVAMLGHALWQRRFGGDTSIVGRIVRVASEEGDVVELVRIVGVLPDGFYHGRDSRDTIDLLSPLRTATRAYMVRFAHGVDPVQAEVRLSAAARTVGTNIPADWTGIRLESAHARYTEGIRPVLQSVSLASAGVLLVVVLNIAVLVMLRALRKEQEFAVRTALGASRFRLSRIIGIETALLVGVACLVSLIISRAVLSTLAPVVATQLGRPAPRGVDSVGLNDGVIVQTLIIAAVITMALGIAPLLIATRARVAAALQGNRSSTTSPAFRRARVVLLVGEVAGSLALLIGCATMVRSAFNIATIDRGFDAGDIVTARLAYPGSVFADAPSRTAYHRRLTNDAAAQRMSLAFASWPPYADAADQVIEADNGATTRAGTINASDRYFELFHIPILHGRAFNQDDRIGSTPVVVLSATLAQRLWPAGDVLGRRIRMIDVAARDSVPSAWHTVTGVVGDVRQSFADNQQADVYRSYAQYPPDRFATLYVRAEQPGIDAARQLPELVRRVEPRVTVGLIRNLRDSDRESSQTRFLTTLLSVFAITSVTLAVIGIGTVTAYTVQQRAREIAIRQALGAQAGAIVQLFVLNGAFILAAGVVLGLLLSMSGMRLLASRLYGIDVHDAPTWTVATLSLLLLGLASTWWPARRASREQNIRALTSE